MSKWDERLKETIVIKDTIKGDLKRDKFAQMMNKTSNKSLVMKKALSFSKISLGPALVVALLSVMQLPTFAQTRDSLGIIINSGSTNTCPYTISVLPSSQATYTVCGAQGTGQISASLTTKFFSDIRAGEPLSKLPYMSCAKSVSFGTTTKVKYNNEISPDISCPSSDSRVKNLYNDAQAIQQELQFSTSRR